MKKSKYLFFILLFFISLTLAESLILFLINRNLLIDTKTINIFDLILKSSFSLIGATISAAVAILIFSLQQNTKKTEELQKHQKMLYKIQKEYNQNIAIIRALYEKLNTPSFDFKKLIGNKDSELLEIINLYHLQLDFYIINSTVKDFDFSEDDSLIEILRDIKLVEKYLDAIINKLDNKENLETMFDLLFRKIKSIIESYN